MAKQQHARAWQRMLSGRRLDLLDPSPLDVEIEDIAHGLALVARWTGKTEDAHIFSVAQHTLLVAVEARLLAASHLRFGLPLARAAEIERIIKPADRGAAFLEATGLAGFSWPE